MRAKRFFQPPTLFSLFVAPLVFSAVIAVAPSMAADQGTKLYGKVQHPSVAPNKFCAPPYNTCKNGEQWHCSIKSTPFGCGRLLCLPLPNTHC
jgi:hypothetical protein